MPPLSEATRNALVTSFFLPAGHVGGKDDAMASHHPHRELAAAVLVGIPGRVAEAQVEGADAGRQDAFLQNADRPDDQRWLRWC